MRRPLCAAVFLCMLARGASALAQSHDDEAALGQLRVAVNRPETTVQVDGAPALPAPATLRLAPGAHLVRIVSPGFHAWQGTAVVDADAVTRVRAWLRPLPSRGDAWTVAVLGVAAVAVSALFGALSWVDHASLQSDLQAGVLDDHDARIARGQSFAVGADVGWGVSGALAIAALVLFVRDGSAPSTGSVSPPRVRALQP